MEVLEMPEQQQTKGTTKEQAIVSGMLELLGLERETTIPGAPLVFKITRDTAERINAKVGQLVMVDSDGRAITSYGEIVVVETYPPAKPR